MTDHPLLTHSPSHEDNPDACYECTSGIDPCPKHAALAALVEHPTLVLIRGCVEVCANDPQEPQRYREWYAEALARIDAYLEAT